MILLQEDKLFFNRDKNGIEIYFDIKPSNDILDGLKENGWRWNNIKKCWFNTDTDEHRTYANGLLSDLNGKDYDIQIGVDADTTPNVNNIVNTAQIASTVSNTMSTITRQRSAVKKQNLDGYEIGDILVCSWGYSMCLVDFYQVIDVTPHMVTVSEIKSDIVSGDGMQGECVPIKDAFIDKTKIYRCKTNTKYRVSVDGHSASKYIDGKSYHFDHWD